MSGRAWLLVPEQASEHVDVDGFLQRYAQLLVRELVEGERDSEDARPKVQPPGT